MAWSKFDSRMSGSLAGILLALTLAQEVDCVRCWRDELTFIHRPHCCLIFLHKGAGIYEEHINLAIGQRECVRALQVPPPIPVCQTPI